MKFDMHCHTKEGSPDAKLAIEDYIKILSSKGFDGMMISDHDSYNGFRYYKKRNFDKIYPDFVVIQGIEYDTSDAGHILCILPDDVTLKIFEIKGMPVKMLIDVVHHLGGILGPAHPYGIRYQSYFNSLKQHKQMQYMKKFDFVERFNACEDAESNHKADYIARSYNKPGFGGSDAHRAAVAGMGHTIFPESVKIRCNNDLITFIKEDGKGIVTGGSLYTGTAKNKLGVFYDFLLQLYWVYNKSGSKINKFRHDHHLKNIFLKEISSKYEYEPEDFD